MEESTHISPVMGEHKEGNKVREENLWPDRIEEMVASPQGLCRRHFWANRAKKSISRNDSCATESERKKFEDSDSVLSLILPWTPLYRRCRLRARIKRMTTPTPRGRHFPCTLIPL